ncbi:DUF1771-domain-containing protein [Lanmaoa asiatica]|nr:DUF1771-domain-containing protein [Lanmaoa asiatica]
MVMGMCLLNIRVVGLNRVTIVDAVESAPFTINAPNFLVMAGLMDILLALVNFLCGGSTTQEQPPSKYEPESRAERPPYQQTTTTRLQQHRVAPEHHRQVSVVPYMTPLDGQLFLECVINEIIPLTHSYAEQESKPISQPRPDHDRPQHDYMALRAKANEHGDLMAQCFQESHEAYGRGDGARAKECSEKGKQHKRTMESLNAKASAGIFRRDDARQDSNPGEIDLHGLYVKEAVSYVDKSVQEARQRGDAEIRHPSVIILGKGLHSDGHVAKIKLAIEDLMKKHNIPSEVDPRNAGVLIARLC